MKPSTTLCIFGLATTCAVGLLWYSALRQTSPSTANEAAALGTG